MITVPDIIYNISLYLPFEQRFRITEVCKTWKSTLERNDYYWKNTYDEVSLEFGLEGLNEGKGFEFWKEKTKEVLVRNRCKFVPLFGVKVSENGRRVEFNKVIRRRKHNKIDSWPIAFVYGGENTIFHKSDNCLWMFGIEKVGGSNGKELKKREFRRFCFALTPCPKDLGDHTEIKKASLTGMGFCMEVLNHCTGYYYQFGRRARVEDMVYDMTPMITTNLTNDLQDKGRTIDMGLLTICAGDVMTVVWNGKDRKIYLCLNETLIFDGTNRGNKGNFVPGYTNSGNLRYDRRTGFVKPDGERNVMAVQGNKGSAMKFLKFERRRSSENKFEVEEVRGKILKMMKEKNGFMKKNKEGTGKGGWLDYFSSLF